MKKNLAFYLFVIFSIVVLDQYTKYLVASNFYLGESIKIIDGLLNFTYAINSGAAFSFGGDFANWARYLLFLALPVVACFWLFALLVKSFQGPRILTWAYTLILGGAIGNLIDRFRLDYVVDFIDFYQGDAHFATFNIADAAISVAAGLLILDFFLNKKEERKLKNAKKNLAK
ncbi:MAG: signal peptidase II [Bacteriovoracaceae bacterium]